MGQSGGGRAELLFFGKRHQETWFVSLGLKELPLLGYVFITSALHFQEIGINMSNHGWGDLKARGYLLS